MKVSALIANAYYLTNVVARGAETVSGPQVTDGLNALNALLSILSRNGPFISYVTTLEMPTVVGQEIYELDGFVEIDTLTYTWDTIRYPLVRANENMYFNYGRANGIESLPYNYYVERQKGKMLLYLYWLPINVYVLNIRGKKALTSVTLTQELDDTLDLFYQNYLMYKLASKLAQLYQIPLPPDTKAELDDLERSTKDFIGVDLSIQKFSSLGSQNFLNYAQVNFGRGWYATK